MRTLYDVLGANPSDDGITLKNAFRKAVKDSHPDIHPDDPYTALRFRQIVRAHAILSDAEQRAAYDRFMEFELLQPEGTAISNKMQNIASGAVAVGAFLVSLIAATLFVHLSKAPVPTGTSVEIIARGSGEVNSATPIEQRDMTGRGEARDLPQRVVDEPMASGAVAPVTSTVSVEEVGNRGPLIARGSGEVSSATPMEQRDMTGRGESRDASQRVVDDPIASGAVGPVKSTVSVDEAGNRGPYPELTSHDAKFYRQRGALSYRSGDFYLAIADFDLAIRLDPNFEAAYIDRSIVFYRMGEIKRAFADIAQAKRIRNSQDTKTSKSGRKFLLSNRN